MEEYRDYKQALKEVDVILNNTNLNDVSKISVSFLQFIENNEDFEYEPIINFREPLSKQNLKTETIEILSLIYLKYWCDNEIKKKEYEDLLEKNEKEYEEKINISNIFGEKQKIINPKTNINESENMSMIQFKKKNNIFMRIINWFKGRN